MPIPTSRTRFMSRFVSRAVPLSCLLLVSALACDRRLEAWVPPEQEPPAAEGRIRVPGLQTPQPQSARAAPLDRAGAGSLMGTVRLSGDGAAVRGGVLYVIARAAGGGPPLAVKRLPPGPFPLDFTIGPADVMMQGRPFEGPIQLSARLDADGDPITRGETDLEAVPLSGLQPGASGLELVLR